MKTLKITLAALAAAFMACAFVPQGQAALINGAITFAGGATYDKAEDFGFMYMHSFVDPDGHGWGLFHMNAPPAKA